MIDSKNYEEITDEEITFFPALDETEDYECLECFYCTIL